MGVLNDNVDGLITAIAKSAKWQDWIGAADEAAARARIIKRGTKTPSAIARPRILLPGNNTLNQRSVGADNPFIYSGTLLVLIEGDALDVLIHDPPYLFEYLFRRLALHCALRLDDGELLGTFGRYTHANVIS